MPPLSRLTLAIAASSMTLASHAQEASEPMTQDTLVVVGSRTPTEISQIPGAVHVIEGHELQRQTRGGDDLKAALGKLVPGLDFAPQGRTNYGQNLRGRSVQVLIDGVSLNSSRGLSRQFDSIDPFNIERVEVLSGATSLYGGGATGGIINIITKQATRPALGLESELGITSGFHDGDDVDYRVAQAISGGNEVARGRLAVAYRDNGRHFDAGGNEIFPDIAQTDLQDNRGIDVLGSLEVELSDEQSLRLGTQLYRSGYEGNRGVYFPNLSDTSPSLEGAEIRDGYRSDRDPTTDRRMLNLQYHHGNLLGQDFYLQAFHREEEASFQAFPYPSPDWQAPDAYTFSASKQDTRLSGLKALFAAELRDDLSLTYGLDLDRESFDADQMTFDRAVSDATGGLVQEEADVSPRYPGYRLDTLSAFAQGDWWASESLKLSAGARRQHTDVSIDDFRGIPGGDNDYDTTLFNASALYDFDGGQQAWLRYSQGFELPDPAKYYGRPGISVDDNPLSAIETDQVELGWRRQGGNWIAQAALYYAWSDKALQINSGDLSVDVIDDKKRDYGLEATLTRYVGENIEAGGTLHLVRSEQQDDEGEWQKRDATSASLSTATAFVGWSDLEHSARLQANHTLDLKDDTDRQIDGFTTLDLTLAKQTDIGHLTLGVQNLLDEQYSTVWGQRAEIFYSPYYGPAYLYDYQGRGRTYTLTWSVDY